VQGFGFDALDGNLMLTVLTDGGAVACPVGLKGQRLVSTVSSVNPACTAALSAAMPDDDTLNVEIRWLESCRVHRLAFRFDETGADVVSSMDRVGGFDVPDETARLLKEGGTHA